MRGLSDPIGVLMVSAAFFSEAWVVSVPWASSTLIGKVSIGVSFAETFSVQPPEAPDAIEKNSVAS